MTIIQADILEWCKSYKGPKMHACLCDPPYHLTEIGRTFQANGGSIDPRTGRERSNSRRDAKGFMGKDWDGGDIAFRSETWAAIAQHLYPGAWGMAFAGSRGWHRMACAIEDAGLIIQPTIFGWSYGCLSDDTEILTTNGWERYRKSIANSTVMCYNPDTDALEWHRVQELVAYDYDETAYRIHSDNTDQLVSRNHRCIVERGGRWVFEYAERLGATERIPITTEAYIQAAQAVPGRAAHRQGDNLPGLWYASLQATGLAQKGAGRADMRECVSGHSARAQSSDPRASQANQHQQPGQEKPKEGQPRRVQSRMERRGNVLQETRQLYGREVHTLPSRVSEHGAQGWLCNGASDLGRTGDRAVAAAHRGGASYRPQSSQQSAEQLAAVCEQPRSQALRAPRVASPDLATVTPLHYRGVVWCVRVPTGAFVARRNGKIFLTGNSGFPKATRIDTQIDAAAFRAWLKLHPEEHAALQAARDAEKAARRAKNTAAIKETRAALQALTVTYKAAAGLLPEKIGTKKHQPKFAAAELGYREKDNGYNSRERETFDVMDCATEAARYWLGHRYGGQALKPALEPIIVFQKPYEGSPLSCITSTGAGALWIDGGRIDTGERWSRNNAPGQNGIFNASGGPVESASGRWPANLVLSHHPACNGECVPGCPVAALGAQSGERESRPGATKKGQTQPSLYDGGWMPADDGISYPGDTGTAARFFFQSDYMYERLELADAIAYVAKASRAEREAGLDPRQTALMRLLDDSEDWEEFEEQETSPIYGNETVEGAAHATRRPRHGFDTTTVIDGRQTPIDNPYQRGETVRRNSHPTIKPISLTRYLATLLLPPAEYGPRRLLVPFSGASSEMIGADLAGWEDVLGVELESDHVAIANARRAYWQQRRWELGDPARKLTVKAPAKAAVGQVDMFAEEAS